MAEAALTAPQLNWLAQYLATTSPHGCGPTLSATLVAGGRSNLTYFLTDGTHDWVLRRPPLGHVLETAHDMRREFTVLTALGPTAVPVPRTIGYVADVSVLGSPFYVVTRVAGLTLRTAQDMRALDAEHARRASYSFIDVFARLHTLDPAAIGLSEFGRPAGYLQRQLVRWQRQLAGSITRPVQGFAELAGALTAATPTTQWTGLVHGDPRLDNALVRPEGQVAALLDWEMSTLGDPLTDLGLLCLFWEGLAGLDNPIFGSPAEHPGYPPFSELATRYAATTGRDLPDLSWYQAFAIFKFAVICEGIHARHSQGLTIGDGFDGIGAMVPALIERGHAAIASTPAARGHAG